MIESSRIRLRSIKKSDNQLLFQLSSNKKNLEFFEMEPFNDISQATEFISTVIRDITKDNVYFWIIEDKESNESLGTICLWGFNEDKTSCEVGYELLQSKQKRGYATQSLSMIIAFASSTLGLKEITAITHEHHISSIKMLERHNFIDCGYIIDLVPDTIGNKHQKLFKLIFN
jgi:ribosomal-protein-alanine N-acetyltransferase